jgi:hypothetical protein
LKEAIAMAGFGRYKLTDALPEQQEWAQEPGPGGAGARGLPARRGKGNRKDKSARKKGNLSATRGGLGAEQLREARESVQAKNAEASTRDRMVEIGRGNQQAGRQGAK